MPRALIGVLLVLASAAAWAQAYPDRPLRLVVGFPPGGSGDFLARIIAEDLTREIGQPVVVDNKPGAGSNIAAEHVARAAPDGYTILLAGNFTHAINPWLYKNLSWDPHRDFTPITKVALMSVTSRPPERGYADEELIAGQERAEVVLRHARQRHSLSLARRSTASRAPTWHVPFRAAPAAGCWRRCAVMIGRRRWYSRRSAPGSWCRSR